MSHHDVTPLQPPTNVPTKYQHPTSYDFQDIAQTRFYRSRSQRQGQRSNQGHTMTLHTYNQCPYQLSTLYTLRFPRHSPDKILKVKVTMARSLVRSRSLCRCTPIPPNQCPYQVSTSYTLWFLKYSPNKIVKVTP